MDSWRNHYYGVLQSFRLRALEFASALDFFFFVLGLYLFSKGGAGEGSASLSSFVYVCYCCIPPTHPGLLHVRRATRMSFLYYIRRRTKESLGKEIPGLLCSRSTKIEIRRNFLFLGKYYTLLLPTSIVRVLSLLIDIPYLFGCYYWWLSCEDNL
jgi:hypothetical protein